MSPRGSKFPRLSDEYFIESLEAEVKPKATESLMAPSGKEGSVQNNPQAVQEAEEEVGGCDSFLSQ